MQAVTGVLGLINILKFYYKNTDRTNIENEIIKLT